MKTGERIKAYRRLRKLTQQQLGEKLGLAANTISDIERGKYSLDSDLLSPLCWELGITPKDILDGAGSDWGVTDIEWGRGILEAYTAASYETQKAACAVLSISHVVPYKLSAPKLREMLVYAHPAAAGLPLYAESDFERIEFPEGKIPAGADFGIRISGNSMEPTIEDGAIVWVHKHVEIRDGEIGIFMLNDSAVCKRARFNGNGRIKYLESDNPAYAPITGGDLDGLRVVGRVLL